MTRLNIHSTILMKKKKKEKKSSWALGQCKQAKNAEVCPDSHHYCLLFIHSLTRLH